MIAAYYYIPSVLLLFGVFFLFQIWNAFFFLLGIQLIVLAFIFLLHFFAQNAENVLYLGTLFLGVISLVQAGFSLNHLKKALINEPDSD